MRPGGVGYRRSGVAVVAAVLSTGLAAMMGSAAGTGIQPAAASGPAPGTPVYMARDVRDMEAAFGREIGPGGELTSPAYLAGLGPDVAATAIAYGVDDAQDPTDPALTPGNLVPGWSAGTPDRSQWAGTRGQELSVHFAAPDGAVLAGTLFSPLADATDPYTHQPLSPPYPGVVIVTGSIQASAAMYAWLAEDLAERGYVVLTFDVQGQGQSRTFPEQGPVAGVPGCDVPQWVSSGSSSQATPCDGVPSEQQTSFDDDAEAAITYFESAANPLSGELEHTFSNPADPSRHVPLALIGHSTGAVTVTYLQQVDSRIATIVALDKITATCDAIADDEAEITMPALPCPISPEVPALGIQSEYGFAPQPYWEASCSSFEPCPAAPDASYAPPDVDQAPDPNREEATGFDTWQSAGVDSMVIVPRASTHLDYTDEPPSLPASQWGQAMASYYTQAWLDRYLKGDEQTLATLTDGPAPHLLATSLVYLAPTPQGVWTSVTLDRDSRLSFYFCSDYSFAVHNGQSAAIARDDDLIGDGCS